VFGVEALVRWRYAEHSLVGPPEFVPLAEETGLILPIDRWVLSEACRQAGDWNTRLGLDRALTINVNLSARQLQQIDLPEFTASALARGGLDARHLVIEITESLLLLDTEATLDRLHRLRQLGVRVAIDDFGTGYASLAYLRQFPVDIIKIDKSFVAGAGAGKVCPGRAHAGAPALARGIVQLGHTLRLATIAEGIETAEQLAELRAAGCPYGQGFYFAKPVTAGEIEAMLREAAGVPVRPALVRTPA
jgi:EAL domain-containing protein (putative c-di-GMP-specific phosphodiesterase class I)